MKRSRYLAVVLAATLLAPAAFAQAPLIPAGLNLGGTSFLDGGPPAGPGFYFTEYFQYYHSGKVRAEAPLGGDADIHANVFASLNQVIYQSDQKVFLGGKWGLDLIVPIIAYDLQTPIMGTRQVGVGDVYVGPFIQWDPIVKDGRPIFMHRFEAQIITPTGDLDRGLGNGAVMVDPYWSGTLFITPKWTASTRIHFLWSDENKFHNQPGEAIHLNFATEYEVIAKTLRLGVNGYYYGELRDDRLNNQRIDDTASQVLGVGPGALWHINKNNHLFLNAYFETAARNATEGMRFWLRFVHHF